MPELSQSPSTISGRDAATKTGHTVQWLSVTALAVLVITTMLEWYWVWGLLFVYWAAAAVAVGETYLVETVHRSNSPILFWSINAMWAVFGIWYLIDDLVPRILP